MFLITGKEKLASHFQQAKSSNMAEVRMKSKKKLALKGQERVLWDETKWRPLKVILF